jgi:hypothetical protein
MARNRKDQGHAILARFGVTRALYLAGSVSDLESTGAADYCSLDFNQARPTTVRRQPSSEGCLGCRASGVASRGLPNASAHRPSFT